MFRWLSIVEPTLVFLGGVLALWIGVKGIWVSSSENNPTRFSVNELVQNHDGQQWLRLKGRVPAEMVFTRLSKTNRNAPRPTYKIWVPLVSEAWRPNDPVHALVCKVCFAPPQAESWKRRFADEKDHTFTGMLRPFGGPRDYQQMFPKLKFAEPLFFLNEGNEPHGAVGMYFIAVLGLVLIMVGGLRIYRAFRP